MKYLTKKISDFFNKYKKLDVKEILYDNDICE